MLKRNEDVEVQKYCNTRNLNVSIKMNWRSFKI